MEVMLSRTVMWNPYCWFEPAYGLKSIHPVRAGNTKWYRFGTTGTGSWTEAGPQNMARPRLSDDTTAHINEIYREYTDQEPPDFETALATVLELASAKLEDDRGWRPGDYAKKTMQMVIDDTAKQSAQPSRSPSVINDHTDFRAVLDDDGRVEIPIGERRALELESDDLLEVTVRKFDRDNDS